MAHLSSTLNARSFYLRHGWRVIEECTHELRSGMKIPCIRMQKDLIAVRG